MDAVRYFKLQNQGVFLACIHVNYRLGGEGRWRIWRPSNRADICAGAEGTLDLKKLGIEDGSRVRLVAFVAAGADATAAEEYIFYSNTSRMAVYQISGATLTNKLRLVSYD